ncbi:Thiamine pyrophosphate enzyme, C-terminal TPP-binding [Sesbania bispinosa]|nr:Thiamine pyrophosphate enzyme, C-terminal TPP-binding [Sesbania bispinosa]
MGEEFSYSSNRQLFAAIPSLIVQSINELLESKGIKGKLDLEAWREELSVQEQRFSLSYKTFEDGISPQYAIQVLDELTNGNAIVSTGVGQHQMWATQFYKYKRPRQWLTSGVLGSMGFGLPARNGVVVAHPSAI